MPKRVAMCVSRPNCEPPTAAAKLDAAALSGAVGVAPAGGLPIQSQHTAKNKPKQARMRGRSPTIPQPPCQTMHTAQPQLRARTPPCAPTPGSVPDSTVDVGIIVAAIESQQSRPPPQKASPAR